MGIGVAPDGDLVLIEQMVAATESAIIVPAHTRPAREMPGANAFLAPEHKVVLSQDADRGRRTGRPAVQNPYLGLRNYTDNLLRRGFTDADIDGSGRDALIDALVAHGSPEMIDARVDDHLTAGADHLGIQVLTEDPTASPVQAFRVLAEHRHAQWEHDGAGPLEQAPAAIAIRAPAAGPPAPVAPRATGT
ncbi:LLM class oxidoreductase [Pseudonocardia alni]|uniref:hypothetical protein n=1 Tax=Pseudonocardia alni TaxID=33907 RepID=UPI0012FE4895|nr:hypothetical protein [Pseudonocardia alni]